MPDALILAAGRGTRMKSRLPKALHSLAGRPMVQALIDRAREAGCSKIFVVAGHQIDAVRKALPKDVTVIHQKEQHGSGHAVMIAEKALQHSKTDLLVLYCDTPLLKTETLKNLLLARKQSGVDASLLSADMSQPKGYGRIVRRRGDFVDRVVEENDATDEERAIREINVGCYAFDKKKLFAALKQIQKNPKKKEYYLTDVVGILSQDNGVCVYKSQDADETHGVNTRQELSRAEKIMQTRINEYWMSRGVGIRDPKSTFIDSDVRIGQDTTLLPHTVLEQGSVVGERCTIGPFARIRGGSEIGNRVVIGNFVEIVRSKIGSGTQVKHLSYLGDAHLGENVNIGAGTITANYDGRSKHLTKIEDRVQVGSGTMLVAPVILGKGSKTGAGAVVTKGTKIKDGAIYVGVPARELQKRKK